MPATTLLNLPAELRNAIAEFVIAHHLDPRHFTFLSDALRKQPGVVNTCRQLRRELRPLYFSALRLVVDVNDRGVPLFNIFLKRADKALLASFQRLSFTKLCSGRGVFSAHIPELQPHSVVYHMPMKDNDPSRIVEKHGLWHKELEGWVFKARPEVDHFGFQSCTNIGKLSVQSLVVRTNPYNQKQELLQMVERIRGQVVVEPDAGKVIQ